MDTTKQRMIWVAVLVCLFAVGMAGLLNFFKYRTTAERIVKERMLVIGDGIENSIQQSLALGLQFSDLNTLPSTLARELDVDDVTIDIEVFDIDGRPMYNAEKTLPLRPMSPKWLEAARRAGKEDWSVDDGDQSAVGIALENNFDLPIGYLAIRYDSHKLREAENAVAMQLLSASLGVFVVSAALASLALIWVMGRLSRQVAAIEQALQSAEPARLPDEVRKGPFGRAMARFFETVHAAEAQIATLRSHLVRGDAR